VRQSQSASELRHSASLRDAIALSEAMPKALRDLRFGRCVINSVRLLNKEVFYWAFSLSPFHELIGIQEMRLILYSKPGCHLCEGLQEKLEKIENIDFELEIRDIMTFDEWFAAYEYEVPVLYVTNRRDAESAEEKMIPRPSPRVTVPQLEKMLRKYL
jgi:glutaredoxin